MDDIVRYHLVRLAPLEFLDVAQWTRKIALETVWMARVSCESGLYYRIIRLLGKSSVNDAWSKLTIFTKCNFDEIYFEIRVWRLIHDDVVSAFRLYEYIRYFDYDVVGAMLNTFKRYFSLDDIYYIIGYLTQGMQSELKNYFIIGAKYQQNPYYHGKLWRMRNPRLV